MLQLIFPNETHKNAYEKMYNKAIEDNADYVECDFINVTMLRSGIFVSLIKDCFYKLKIRQTYLQVCRLLFCYNYKLKSTDYIIELMRPPFLMMFWMNSGNGSAWYVLPVVSLVMTPVSKFTETVSPSLISFAASSHSRIGRPMLIELR